MATAKTTPSTAEEFWGLVIRSRLHDPARVAAFQTAFASQAASADATPAAIAQWLVAQRHLTAWQARRLLRGEPGPFFIGDYRLLERIESLDGAHVVRAVHAPSSKRVLLAMLDRTRCREVQTWTDIVRRTAVAHQAADPMFSRTWALEQLDGNRVIVCEDVIGASLSEELATRGGLPVQEAGWIAMQLARAVTEHHRLAGPHGAISTESLRRDAASGTVRLLHYPLVGDPHTGTPRVPIDDPKRVARLGTTAAFVAPECILGGGAVSEVSDVYAIGCVLSALVTGTPPGWKGDAATTLESTARVGFEPPGPPEVPLEVGTLVGYLSARDPAARYPTAADAAAAIAACFGFPQVVGPAAEDAPVPFGQPPAAGPFAVGFDFPDVTPDVTRAGAVTDVSPASATTGRNAAGVPNEATRRARRRAAIFRAGVVGLAAAAMIATVAGIVSMQGGPRPVRPAAARPKPDPVERQASAPTVPDEPPPDEPPPDAMVATAASGDTVTPAAAVRIVSDDDALWDAPTHGSPPSLDFLPPGSQAMMVVRLGEAIATDEGRRFLEALGPAAEAAVESASSLCGCPPEGIERVLAGWQTDQSGKPVAAFAFELAEPIDAASPPASWGSMVADRSKAAPDETIHRGKALSLALPAARGGKLLVAAPHDLVELMLETAGAPQLTRDLQRLADKLDGGRHLVVLGSPAWLANDGRDMLAGPLGRIARPIGGFFGDGVAAAAVSLHFGSTAYAEVLAVPPADTAAVTLAERLFDQVVELPASVEEFMATIDLHPYGRKLVNRLPGMIAILADNLRQGVEDELAMLNCHLPPTAPHNIALAAEIALEQEPGQAVAAAEPGPTRQAKGVEAALQKKLSLSFTRDSLDRTMAQISEEMGVAIEILGGDLQLEGITQNQSFGLDERDVTLDALLKTILAKANPDGKLVYVIRKNGAGESIVITTRTKAAERGETLPAGFEKDEPAKKKK